MYDNELPKPRPEDSVWWHEPSESWLATSEYATRPLILKMVNTGTVYGRVHLQGWQWIEVDNPESRLRQGELFSAPTHL